jgi:DNA-binding CsgD family transcriptional regulator
MVCWMSGRPPMWAPLDAALAELTSPAPTHLTLCRSTFGNPAQLDHSLLQQVDTALSGLQHESNPVAIIRTHLSCVYIDRLGDCREALRRVVRDGRDGGAVALAINALIGSSVDDWWTGRWDEARELTAEGVLLCQRHGYRRYSFVLGDYISSLVAAARGQNEVSAEGADNLRDLASDTGCGLADQFAHHLRTISAIAGGAFEDAYLHANAISPAGVLTPFTPHAFWVLFDLVEAAVHTNRMQEARAHVEAMRQAKIAETSTRLALILMACSAMTGPMDQTTAFFETALAVPGAQRWQFDYARVQLAYGEHLRSGHEVAESAMQFHSALHIFEGLQATPWVERTARAIRALGLPSPMGGTPKLSAREREIATLAAAGLTNKQIGERLQMSHRAVGGHLYRIFPLLGVSSRAALHDAMEVLSQHD